MTEHPATLSEVANLRCWGYVVGLAGWLPHGVYVVKPGSSGNDGRPADLLPVGIRLMRA